MLRLLLDENFNRRILRGIKLRLPGAELLRAQDAGISGMSDPELLEWAAARQLILVTHDVQTMVGFAYERIATGKYLAGVLIVSDDLPIGLAIEELVTIIFCSDARNGRIASFTCQSD